MFKEKRLRKNLERKKEKQSSSISKSLELQEDGYITLCPYPNLIQDPPKRTKTNDSLFPFPFLLFFPFCRYHMQIRSFSLQMLKSLSWPFIEILSKRSTFHTCLFLKIVLLFVVYCYWVFNRT